jgi:hypothetical protein
VTSITVYGASDDLIEVEGDLREEFDGSEGVTYFAFSDGTVLSIEFGGKGMWTIRRLVEGTASYSQHDATDVDDDYSDRATLDGDIRWLVCGGGFERVKP